MINVVVVNRKMKTKLSLSCTFSAWIFCSTSWWGLLLLLSAPLVRSVPLNIEGPSREVTNNSLTDFDSSAISRGCRYKALFYTSGDEVSTDEPCLACQCKGTVVVCKLRICPEIPVPPPPGCIVVHKAKSCCSQLICHGQESTKKISREQRFPINVSNETLLASVNDTKDAGYCIVDGTVYAEGSAMRSSTLCQYCFCIRGEMKCSSPQCVIPMKGCKPRFRSYACCPTNYDCGQSNATAILKTIPSSTQVPQFLKGCLVSGQFVPEGEPVLPVQLAGAAPGNMSTGMGATTNVCQTCFCMGGVVHCRPLECDQPIDGCRPIMEDGHCCPDRYDCSKPHEDVTTLPPTSSSSSVASLSSNLPFSSSYATTLRTTTEEIVNRALAASRKHDATAGTTTLPGFDDEEMTTSSNDDSFERVAVIQMSGSSEESTAAVPIGQRQRITSSSATIGGFKNRSDLGSREERRSKDGDELTPRQQSSEDDEKDEANFGMFDTTTASIEELGTTTSFEDSTEPSTTMYSDIEPDEDVDEQETTQMNSFPEEATTGNYISWDDHGESTFRSFPEFPDIYHDEDQGSPHTTTVVVTDESNESTSPYSTFLSSQSTETPSTTLSDLASLPASIPISTTSKSSTNGPLEFIPFGVEDAVMPTEDNDTLLPILDSSNLENIGALLQNSNVSLLKPLELKFMNGTDETHVAEGSHEAENIEAALPILVERDEHSHLQKESPAKIPQIQSISTSLYNNGYYPHGSIIQDDGSHPEDLFVEQGELNKREQDMVHSQPDGSIGSTSEHPTASSTLSTVRSTTKRPEQPLKAISSIDKFIPSYSPATVQPGAQQPIANPSRTYSKFGMQDSPLHRYDHNTPGANGFGGGLIPQTTVPAPTRNPTQQLYHHRYYNEPEEIPTSRVNNPYNYHNIDNKPQRGQGGQGIGMLPQLYKNNNQFFYEDSSAALDSYEDDYETYAQTTGNNVLAPKPTTSTGPQHHRIVTTSTSTKAPPRTTSPTQFLGERVRLPSYNQQRATSTPRYRYAYINNRQSVQSKLTTERTAITTTADLKQHAPFPFNLPKTQDSSLYNLGIKLSGCNVVGKMYSVGDVIDELSSDCVRCMCSHIGVHCAEFSC